MISLTQYTTMMIGNDNNNNNNNISIIDSVNDAVNDAVNSFHQDPAQQQRLSSFEGFDDLVEHLHTLKNNDFDHMINKEMKKMFSAAAATAATSSSSYYDDDDHHHHH